jgi:hypothetical protein
MVFSDTTTKAGILQRIEDYAGFDDGIITGDNTLTRKFTGHVNETLHDIITEIMVANDSFDWDDPTRSDFAVATTPLVANQRDYQFDSISFLKLKRLDVTYDGTNWYRATPFDSGSYTEGLGNDTATDAEFSKTEPMYDPKAFGFWLYPRASAADVTAGASARIEFVRAFDEFTYDDTTKEPPIDRPFHELIALGAALKWSVMKNDPRATNLAALYQAGLAKLKSYYSKRNEDSFMSFKGSFIDSYK